MTRKTAITHYDHELRWGHYSIPGQPYMLVFHVSEPQRELRNMTMEYEIRLHRCVLNDGGSMPVSIATSHVPVERLDGAQDWEAVLWHLVSNVYVDWGRKDHPV